MKKQICIIILLLTCRICTAQNLVPNGNFEDTIFCPNYGQINAVALWTNPTLGDPNYYNSCSPYTISSVPTNFSGFGYQFAHSGVAYCGINLKYIITPIDSQRDYIEVPLISSLIPNQCYHFEMFVNLLNNSAYTTDAIGAYFSDTLVSGVNSWHVLPFTPQIENTVGNFFDTLSWTLVSGNFTATGGEDYLIIGNFRTEANTTLVPVNVGGWDLVVYIDDVSLIQVPPCNTGLNEVNKKTTVNIYPNPLTNKLNITNSNNEISEVVLYDITSRKLLQQKFTNSISINTEQLAKGIYLYEVINKNGVIKKGKVVKE